MKEKYTRTITATIILAIFLVSCQKLDEIILTIGGDLSTPEPVTTPVKRYDSPLTEFEPLQLAWFYKPPESSTDMNAIAANFSLLILTRNDETERETLRELGSTSPVLQYLRFEAIMDTGNCSAKPFQNQAANLEGDFCSIEEHHEDWFLKDINGRKIQYKDSDYVVMDPGNSEWQAYFLDKVKGFQKDEGWQGLFLDNVDAGLGRFDNMLLLLDAYADDRSYQNAVKSFLEYLYQSYFKPSGKPLYANIPYLEDEHVWFEYLAHLDGAMLEAFAADWDNGYLSEAEWLEQLTLAEETQALGKSIILVTQGNVNDQQRMQFGLASFLLVNSGRAYFRYSSHEAYRDLWWYPQYESDLGQPLGPRYPDGSQWRRDFENGYVTVNPEKHSAAIQVN
jgi:hypothetical protein